jgi:hypothetical protein
MINPNFSGTNSREEKVPSKLLCAWISAARQVKFVGNTWRGLLEMQGDSLRLYGYKRWKNDGENIRRTIYSTVTDFAKFLG